MATQVNANILRAYLDSKKGELRHSAPKVGKEAEKTLPLGPVNPKLVSENISLDMFAAAIEEATKTKELPSNKENTDVATKTDITPKEEVPVNTTTTNEQKAKINMLKETYDISEETLLPDGSVQIKIQNSSAVITYNNKGELVSASDVTGVMLKNFLFKGNKELITSAYATVPDGEDKADNFNKGTFNVTRNDAGEIEASFIKGYTKPAKPAETKQSGSNTASDVSTSEAAVVYVAGEQVETKAAEEKKEDTEASSEQEAETVTQTEETTETAEAKEVTETAEAAATTETENTEKAEKAEEKTESTENAETKTEKQTANGKVNGLSKTTYDFLASQNIIGGNQSFKTKSDNNNSITLQYENGTEMDIKLTRDNNGNVVSAEITYLERHGMLYNTEGICEAARDLGISLAEMLTGEDEEGKDLYGITAHPETNAMDITKSTDPNFKIHIDCSHKQARNGQNLSGSITENILESYLSEKQIKGIKSQVESLTNSLNNGSDDALSYEDAIFNIEYNEHFPLFFWQNDNINVKCTIGGYEYTFVFEKDGDNWKCTNSPLK